MHEGLLSLACAGMMEAEDQIPDPRRLSSARDMLWCSMVDEKGLITMGMLEKAVRETAGGRCSPEARTECEGAKENAGPGKNATGIMNQFRLPNAQCLLAKSFRKTRPSLP